MSHVPFFSFSDNARSLQHFTSIYPILSFFGIDVMYFSSTYITFNPQKTLTFCVLSGQYPFGFIPICPVIIHSFLCIFIWRHFSICQRTSSVGLLAVDFLRVFCFLGFFSFPENIFIPPIFLKDIFTEFRILDWQISFSPLMISFHGCSVISVERVVSIAALKVICLYSWDCFSDLLFVFSFE